MARSKFGGDFSDVGLSTLLAIVAKVHYTTGLRARDKPFQFRTRRSSPSTGVPCPFADGEWLGKDRHGPDRGGALYDEICQIKK